MSKNEPTPLRPFADLLSFEDYGAGLGAAATVLRANATSTSLGAPVPTCPGWTVADLVAHQGMVHRWAAGILSAAAGAAAPDPAGLEREGRESDDLLQWFDDGATDLLDVLSKTPSDWDGFFFLRGLPSRRDGWARRQCHETTMHAVDAMSARLTRVPSAEQLWFSPALAADGIDELIMGFLPRRSTTLRSPEPVTLEIGTTDTGHAWTVEIGEEAPVVHRAPTEQADARWRGTAIDMYLHLWNRLPQSAIGEDGGQAEARIRAQHLTAYGSGTTRLWRETMTVVFG
ncbi:MAG: maleylpyruvate isomerase family mycothiol-dependent enzyme [Actinomycetia bacterium]|nr:maleylpyruvate isomerase family mycothiol-dependent enzyme [Actinomycetes bacterium]